MKTDDYTLEFDLSPYTTLDNFALLADQKYNLGDRDGWFGCFRGGISGLCARVLGVRVHYHKIHSWELEFKSPQIVEYNLSSVFFNMDSAIECMVFALNALGYIADSKLFIDITDEKKLRKVSPYNILGMPPKYSTEFVEGYDYYFPSLKEYWHENRDLIYAISEQHDVSKHRQTIYIGGRIRNDPPPGFFERIRIKNNVAKQALYSPMAEIRLMPQPKTPWEQQRSKNNRDYDKLESITEKFRIFINTCGAKALEDATTTIKLNYSEFIKLQ